MKIVKLNQQQLKNIADKVIEEQLFNKIKDKLKTTVNNLTDKFSSEKPLPGKQPESTEKPLSQQYQEFIKKWEPINKDTTNYKVLVYTQSQNANIIDSELQMKAGQIVNQKMQGQIKPGEARGFKLKGSFIPLDEVSYMVEENGRTTYYSAKLIEFTPSK
jgi:hypothetical protein